MCRNRNPCLVLRTELADWYTARSRCRTLGGHLVKMGDAAIHDRVRSVINAAGTTEKYWIGLTRTSTTGQGKGWEWRSGKSN